MTHVDMRPFHMAIILIISMRDNFITHMEITAITMVVWLWRQASPKAKYPAMLKKGRPED